MVRAVVVYRHDGLGSRLMAFGNGLRLARVLGVPCGLAWNEPQKVGGILDPGQLLNLRRLPANVRFAPLFNLLQNLGPVRICNDAALGVVDRRALETADVLLCGLSQIQRMSDEADSPELRAGLAAAMRCLVPAPPLVEPLRQFMAGHDLAAAVGVHVRRGDLPDQPAERERLRLIGLDRYFAVIDAVFRHEPLFLCTEDSSVIDAFQARYGARVFHHPTRSWVREEEAAASDALIEMFLLSATKLIVGGPSAFSRFAAARSGLPLVVLRSDVAVERSIELAASLVEAAGAAAPRPL